MLQQFTQAILLVSAISADGFISAFAYGVKKIKIPFFSVMVINIICSLMLAVSLFAGSFLRTFLSEEAAKIICFFILFALGFVKLLDNVLKSLIKKYNRLDKQIKFKLLSLNFILNVYANPEDADEDRSKTLSPAEAASLAVALSLDGLAAGAGAALGGANIPLVITLSFIIGIIAVIFGCFLGNKAARKAKMNFSWLGGAALIGVAVLKLI
ncbi:MAG: sporulation membrane protein YtaF [Oscillospiraceae bacterium]|nr:sporulation membrane protein YtaF [Oscillospiraceae bacterium]